MPAYVRTLKLLKASLLLLLLASCALYAQHQLDQKYGPARVQDRAYSSHTDVLEYHRDIEPIISKRCIVCHACYDAPCQLRMQSMEGLDRGTHKEKVYDGTRLLASNLTRLYVDADTTAAWREKNFFPVLNEREQSAEANLAGSLLYRMLALKNENPLPAEAVLPDSFDFSLNRNQQCPKIEEFDQYAQNYPLWGMPYGLPAIPAEEFSKLEAWLGSGAKYAPPKTLSSAQQQWVAEWEQFFNGTSLREKLMSRYIYEHLFLANLYASAENPVYFKLVRSRTPPGQPLDIIATRRPYDDPGVETFYYRLQYQQDVVVAKNHLPYLMDGARRQRWVELFLKPAFEVTALPSYDPKVAANPFAAFAELPARSRYEFMLDEAQFTIMGFIKGPVCRGQTALNVIQDRFWVMFVNPASMQSHAAENFLRRESDYLRLPSEEESNVLGIGKWFKYSEAQKKYLQAKKAYILERFPTKGDVTLDLVWNGDSNGFSTYEQGGNPNAALTIFRHYDSATVSKGFIGDVPKTAWLIDYPLLERIHYLLVAGFDVYGNVGHQLWTRLYMDFLRMEGEYNFLILLPKETITREIDNWYQGQESQVRDYVKAIQSWSTGASGITYTSDNPKRELFEQLFDYFQPAVAGPDLLNWSADNTPSPLQQLARVRGESLQWLSEVSLLRIGNGDSNDALYSMVVNRAHSNVAHFLFEQYRMLPEQQTLTLTEGVLGDYPNTFFQLKPTELTEFANRIAALESEQDYRALLDRFGVRRSAGGFWDFSDWVMARHALLEPVDAGLLDYNRLENR